MSEYIVFLLNGFMYSNELQLVVYKVIMFLGVSDMGLARCFTL